MGNWSSGLISASHCIVYLRRVVGSIPTLSNYFLYIFNNPPSSQGRANSGFLAIAMGFYCGASPDSDLKLQVLYDVETGLLGDFQSS